MISDIQAVRITGFFHHNLTPVITSALEKAGVTEYHMTAGRWVTLKDRKGYFGLTSESKVLDHPIDIVSILVTPAVEAGVLEVIIRSGALTTPGRGSVFSEDVVIYRAHELCNTISEGPAASGEIRLQNELTGICCIVQKGKGNEVARVALDTGTCVPAITYGNGTGVRDKLGLLRITIPAEKELISITASSYDAEVLMNLLITTGKLNQPGKGFIYLYPIRAGLINIKILQGIPKHAAGIEQIIAAIDEIRGGTSWRARGGAMELDTLKIEDYLNDQVSLTLMCDEGRGEILLKAAMREGIPGGTMNKMKYVSHCQNGSKCISPAREVCTMIIPKSLVQPAAEVMIDHGALDDKTYGQFCLSAIPRAYTFIARK
jgi:hypothetical protein